MAQIDLVDDTWMRVPPALVGGAVADRTNWDHWWPDLTLQVVELRGPLGLRWDVPLARAPRRGEPDAAGSMEVWLEAALDGVVLHYFVWLDPLDGVRLGERSRTRLRRWHARRAKTVFWALKDELEWTSRMSGEPGAGSPTQQRR